MRSINLDQLRALAEVLARGSFTEAARHLNLTQPAVSLQIRELESRWGVQLIERFGKQARATEPGRQLLEHARRIFAECDAAEEGMRRFQDGWIGRVRIGTTLTALLYDLPPVLRELNATHRGVEVSVTNMPTRDAIDMLIANTIDMALVTLPVKRPELRITPLRVGKLVTIVPAAMKDVPRVIVPEWAARHRLVMEHDRGALYALVMRWMVKELPLAQAPMHVGIVEAAKQAVASGLGISFVPDISVTEHSPHIIVRPLKPVVPLALALAEHRNKPPSAALDIVRRALLNLRTQKKLRASRSE